MHRQGEVANNGVVRITLDQDEGAAGMLSRRDSSVVNKPTSQIVLFANEVVQVMMSAQRFYKRLQTGERN